MTHPQPHVLIIGAGIGGLALAIGLKKHNIPFQVYERDPSHNARAQGYRIRVGQEAVVSMRYLFDDETWRLFELTSANIKLALIPEIDAETARVVEPELPPGLESVEDLGSGASNEKPYTVDRGLFRELLVHRLGENLTFGKALDRYEANDGVVTAFFTDGSSAQGTLIVGADGSSSKVRSQHLPHHKIVNTHGRCVFGKTPLSPSLMSTVEPSATSRMSLVKDRSHEELLTMVLEPVIFPHRREVEQAGLTCPPDYIYWVLCTQPGVLHMGEDEKPSFSQDEAEALALDITERWHPSLRPIVTQQGHGNVSVLSIRSCEADLGSWEPSANVTLLGDAVHVMYPAGVGARVALQDAGLLCRLLVEEGQSRETVGKYEKEMRVYAGREVGNSWKMGQIGFGQKKGEERHIGQMMMMNRAKKL